jgi:uncharacterized protein YegL
MSETIDVATRRLPVYLLLDVSGSMGGDPIEATRQGMKSLLGELKGDPQALETVWISVITFASQARQVAPLTELILAREPELNAGGSTSLGAALRMLLDSVRKEVRRTTAEQKGDWKPLVFLMTDGEPTDDWEAAADQVKQAKLGNIIALAAGPAANEQKLKRITDTVVRLHDLQPGALQAFFKWVSSSVSVSSLSMAANANAPVTLPPPPPEITIVP